jgi:hypothetical protein
MKHISTPLLLLLFHFLLIGCEKEIIDEKKEKTTEGTEISIIDDEKQENALTVAQAQLVEDGTPIVIKAYIVASTTRSINNADFEAPFSGSSAIVVADVPDSLVQDRNQLFPICLTDRSKARAALNLEDNPDIWNHIVFLSGTKERYMGMDGMKKVNDWNIIP